MKSSFNNQTMRLALVFLLVLIGSGVLVYAILKQTTGSQTRTTAPIAQPEASTVPRSTAPQAEGNDNFIDRLFGTRTAETSNHTEGWITTLGRITLRLLLAALLGTALAFRPRKAMLGLRRNPYVAQTEILLAIVASALMMVVGDNAARAFGIFAAVSLVRFRTNIRDPKEISVLLISLTLGLATGVGRPDLAIIFCVFVMVVLWILENYEPQQVSRAMELKIETKDIETTQHAVREVISKHGFDSELRTLGRDGDGDRGGKLVYHLDMSPMLSTDRLSEEIFTVDRDNISSVEWEQKKSFSYVYQ